MKTDAPVSHESILHWKDGEFRPIDDLLAVEEPLQIRLQYGTDKNREEKNLTITMRTPGNDFELATGFLMAENIIQKLDDILLIRYCKRVKEEERGNVLIVRLAPSVKLDFSGLERNFLTNSSCGVCGKSAISAIKCNDPALSAGTPKITVPLIKGLNRIMFQSQTVFKYTGGIHASALFDSEGNLKLVREDIGRHNALDKAIGAALNRGILADSILMLSGRISFELVQKAIRARIPVIVAVGAPSSLAVRLAKEKGITLIGFLKENSFNVYSGKERLVM